MSTISFRLQYTFLDPITTLRLDLLLSPWDFTASASLETNFWPCFYWQLTEGWKDEPLKECGKTRANYHGNRMATWKDYCQKPWPKIMAKEYMLAGQKGESVLVRIYMRALNCQIWQDCGQKSWPKNTGRKCLDIWELRRELGGQSPSPV